MPNESQPWTIETLKQYFEAVLHERDKRFKQRFKAQERAVKASQKNVEDRNKQERDWLPRQEYDRAHNDLLNQVKTVTSRLDVLEGQRSGGSSIWGYVVGGVGILIGALTYVLTVVRK